MSTKPILIYKLTPLQIALVDRIAAKENGLLMDAMDYSEIIAYQELSKLGFVNMHAAKRRRISIVLTETGIQACQWLHFKEASRAPYTTTDRCSPTCGRQQIAFSRHSTNRRRCGAQNGTSGLARI